MNHETFIEKIGLMASADTRRSGILASLTTAQAILESGYGTSELAINANALFGIKVNGWTGKTYTKETTEFIDGKRVTVTAEFRAYNSWDESVKDHSDYLTTREKAPGVLRYGNLIWETDYKEACKKIQADGYATAPEYADTLIELIERYNLTRFDIKEAKPMKIYLSPSDQTGNGYRGVNTNEAVQCRRIANATAKALERNGYTVKVGADGTTYQQRTADSNAWGADVHVPIHTNAGGGGGTVVFCYPGRESNKYVKNVYEAVAELSPGRSGKDYGVQAKTGLYEINQSKAPCVYIEVEFHDNPELAKWIVAHVEDAGEAICKGFCKADGKKYVGPDKAPEKPSEKPTEDKIYRVQVGAFKNKANAEKLAQELKGKGYSVYIA